MILSRSSSSAGSTWRRIAESCSPKGKPIALGGRAFEERVHRYEIGGIEAFGGVATRTGRADRASERPDFSARRAAGPLRAVAILHDVEGLSMAEVADCLDITVPTAKARAHRARLLLRQCLGGFMSGATSGVEMAS
jgi:hypothetical protein